MCHRKAEEAAKAAAAEAQEAAEKAALEQDVAAASAAPESPAKQLSEEALLFPPVPPAVSQPLSGAPVSAMRQGITHASLDVNLSGSVAKDLENLVEAAVEAVEADAEVSLWRQCALPQGVTQEAMLKCLSAC